MNKSTLSMFLAGALALGGLARAASTDRWAQEATKLQGFYQDLHENPEVGGEEVRTAAKVAGKMRELGLEVTENIGGHGVIGVLKNGSGPVTLVRAELDALPVPEGTGVAWKSHVDGKMHACGHDFHLTALLGSAEQMVASKGQWRGTIVFLAQPAEELGHGAVTMIKDGVLGKIPKPDRLIALHTTGTVKRGLVGVTSGYALSNADAVHVTFKGRGTHGSRPQEGIDPFIQAAEFTLKMQTLLGREHDARKPAVVSIGAIHGGAKANIIPDEVKMDLTVRTYDPDLRVFLEKRIKEVALGLARLDNAPDPVVVYEHNANVVVNDPALTASMKATFERELGKAQVVDVEPTMASEDFGEFGIAAHAPSVFFWLGEKDDKDPTTSNHSPRYLPDYGTLPTAVHATVAALLSFHKK